MGWYAGGAWNGCVVPCWVEQQAHGLRQRNAKESRNCWDAQGSAGQNQDTLSAVWFLLAMLPSWRIPLPAPAAELGWSRRAGVLILTWVMFRGGPCSFRLPGCGADDIPKAVV